jgi:hypothetical protein
MPFVPTVQPSGTAWSCAICHEHQPTDSPQYLTPALDRDLVQTWDLIHLLCKRCWATLLRFSYSPN